MVTELIEERSVAAKTGSHDRPGKFLTFRIGSELYGIEILKVQEIIGKMKVTSVPQTAAYVCGVINLRGKVISVIDMRKRFDLDLIVDSERNCIIVVNIAMQGVTTTVGLLVDEVAEVLNLSGDQIEPTPTIGSGIDTHFIFGIGKVGDQVLLLLEVDDLLDQYEVEALEETNEIELAK
jgi:purine-binding chemotaxis protein CheW